MLAISIIMAVIIRWKIVASWIDSLEMTIYMTWHRSHLKNLHTSAPVLNYSECSKGALEVHSIGKVPSWLYSQDTIHNSTKY